MIELAEEIRKFIYSGRMCSDIHIKEGSLPRVKTPEGWMMLNPDGKVINGQRLKDIITAMLRVQPEEVKSSLSENYLLRMAEDHENSEIMLTADLAPLLDLDIKVRMCIYFARARSQVGLSLRVIRPIDPVLPMAMEQYLSVPKGLLLVSGPTGAGKTTTALSIISRILQERSVNVVTVEKPVENTIPDAKGIVIQREVGIDCISYRSGLTAALRQKPDVILIGEIFDEETAVAALTTAESGHFVIATIHATSAVGTVQKIQQMTGQNEAVRSVLGVQYQTLLPSADQTQYVMASEYLQLNGNSDMQQAAIDHDYKRMTALLAKSGNLNNTLFNMVHQELITREDARSVSYDPANLTC